MGISVVFQAEIHMENTTGKDTKAAAGSTRMTGTNAPAVMAGGLKRDASEAGNVLNMKSSNFPVPK